RTGSCLPRLRTSPGAPRRSGPFTLLPPPPVPAVPVPVPVPAVPVDEPPSHGPGKHCEFISLSPPRQPPVPASEQTRRIRLVIVIAFRRPTTTSKRTGPPCSRPRAPPTHKDRRGTPRRR